MKISNDIRYVGVNDHNIDLFEGQYVVPNGMAYNSYVILDEKIAIMDTVDIHFTHEWLDNLAEVLDGRKPDYLVVQHMEPDHAANIQNFLKVYPDTTIVANKKTFAMIDQFFDLDESVKREEVTNGGTLTLGKHVLTFVFAPMVHWPEVMVTYDSADKILFSADGFGKFGANDVTEPWDDEARRYFIGIVGKYGPQVQNLLKAAAKLDIAVIAPLHGPVLSENLGHYIALYDKWSSYTPEDEGIVLAYTSVYGHTKDAVMLLEKKLIEKFDMSKFVVCTDAGLSSATNRWFNDYDKEDGFRAFITTQSIKKLKKHLKDWALDPTGWRMVGGPGNKTYDIRALDEEADREKLFIKDRWIKEKTAVNADGGKSSVELEQHLIITFSIKYRDYMRAIRSGQVERAEKMVASGYGTGSRKKQNDPKRFIATDHATADGEIADKSVSYIDKKAIEEEEQYDGFYAVCTNLEDDPDTIAEVNKRRWQIEECFRIIKADFKARPVYVKRKERILAHFITCFISLIVYRYLEKKLDNKYTADQIISTLQEMDFIRYEGKGYQPVYTRTELTDALHKAFGFCTSKQIVPTSKMRNICSQTKK